MSVKFKIGFTIGAETLFGLMSKMLPIEDLSVEELAPKSRVETTPKFVEAPWTKRKVRLKPKRRSDGPNLKEGINGIIMLALTERPQRATDLAPLLRQAGFSPNSVSSRLQALERFKIVTRNDEGIWRVASV
jgi:hypothetical protein